jgi:hypothetical protein
VVVRRGSFKLRAGALEYQQADDPGEPASSSPSTAEIAGASSTTPQPRSRATQTWPIVKLVLQRSREETASGRSSMRRDSAPFSSRSNLTRVRVRIGGAVSAPHRFPLSVVACGAGWDAALGIHRDLVAAICAAVGAGGYVASSANWFGHGRCLPVGDALWMLAADERETSVLLSGLVLLTVNHVRLDPGIAHLPHS